MAPRPPFKSEQTDKIFIIEDLRVEVAELATQLVIVIGGNVVHFMVCQGNLNQLDKDEQIRLLQRKQKDLKRHLEKITINLKPESLPQLQDLQPQLPVTDQKPESLPLQTLPSRSDDTISRIPPQARQQL